MEIVSLFKLSIQALRSLYGEYILSLNKKRYGACGNNVILQPPILITKQINVFLEDNVNIFGYAKLIISQNGKFIIKKNSGAAQGLTVVTGNHTVKPTIGKWHKEVIQDSSTDRDTTVLVEEDVWLASNVTLLPGVKVGRGAIVGAGAVCRSSVPPYSIVIGNPAKVIGFKYTPEEIIEHEKKIYPESERLSREILDKNYQKYYEKRLKKIVEMIK